MAQRWVARGPRFSALGIRTLLALAAVACLGGGGNGGRGVVQGENARRYLGTIEAASVAEARRAFGRGIDAFNAQRWEEALTHFAGVARADSPYRGSALFNTGMLYEAAGELRAARAVLRQALALGVAPARTRLGLLAVRDAQGGEPAAALNPRADDGVDGDDGDGAGGGGASGALALFAEAAREDPDDVLARRNEVAALAALGRAEDARAALDALVAGDANIAAPRLEQVQVMMQAGDPGLPGSGRLERWLECDIAVDQDGWSDVELHSCRVLDGERFLHEEVASDPGDPALWYRLGSYYRNHDRVWDAVRAMSVALRLRPDYDSALAVMGGALTDNTNYSLAVRPLERALALHPADLWARANLVLSLAWTCQAPPRRPSSRTCPLACCLACCLASSQI
jgi:tetratricopeptide (TPR) repeat protein